MQSCGSDFKVLGMANLASYLVYALADAQRAHDAVAPETCYSGRPLIMQSGQACAFALDQLLHVPGSPLCEHCPTLALFSSTLSVTMPVATGALLNDEVEFLDTLPPFSPQRLDMDTENICSEIRTGFPSVCAWRINTSSTLATQFDRVLRNYLWCSYEIEEWGEPLGNIPLVRAMLCDLRQAIDRSLVQLPVPDGNLVVTHTSGSDVHVVSIPSRDVMTRLHAGPCGTLMQPDPIEDCEEM